MNKKNMIITAVVAIALVAAIYLLSSGALTGSSVADLAKEEFAKCLTDSGVKMYGAYWCSHCSEQKKIFGSAFDYINYVECDSSGKNSQRELCLEKGIKGYPTWEINSQMYPGTKQLEELAALSQCEFSG